VRSINDGFSGIAAPFARCGSLLLLASVWSSAASAASTPPVAAPQAAVVSSELIGILDEKPVRRCHASTIVETRRGFLVAWFGGPETVRASVGIWLARNDGGGWGRPVEIANGVGAAGEQQPCWNPVLFRARDGTLLLFYKVGPAPRSWRGMLMSSRDDGATWSIPVPLPEGVLGPVKNKPVELADGRLLCPSSCESRDWHVYFDLTSDLGKTWMVVGPVNDGAAFQAIQPTILRHADGQLQALCRTRQGRIAQVWSRDGGTNWSTMTALNLPNPNSGIDGVTLADGQQVLVYNRSEYNRTPLNVAVSRDGRQWRDVLVLEDGAGEYSYPAAIQASDGKVHITYTYRKHSIKHVVLDPLRLPNPSRP